MPDIFPDGSIALTQIKGDTAVLTHYKNDSTYVSYTIPLSSAHVAITNIMHKGGHDYIYVTAGDRYKLEKQNTEYCLSYDNYSIIVPGEYITWLSSKYVDPVVVAIKDYDFYLVGSFEQGGYKCPKCKCINNAYTFNGICTACGYGHKK